MTSLSKNAWKYKKGTIFFRRGSNSMTAHQGIFELKNTNKSEVEAIERNASNNIELTLNGVFDFINSHSEEYHPTYRVFHEQFVLCWAGKVKQINGKRFYSRVDIALINEQVRLFYSVLDDVQIQINASSFIITEYIYLGIDTDEKHFPLEKTIIHFKNNGKHEIVNEFLFEPPKYDPLILRHIYENNQSIVEKIEKNSPLSVTEHEDLSRLPTNYLICFLNGYKEAGDQLRKAKQHLKALPNKTAYIKYKHAMRVIRKVTYY